MLDRPDRLAFRERGQKRDVTRAIWADLLDWKVDKDSGIPIYQQVADFLRGKIVSGEIPPGSRLPSSRQLLTELGVSRTTIITAYSQLLADGYIVGQIGSGTYVAHDSVNQIDPRSIPSNADDGPNRVGGLSKRGRHYQNIQTDRLVMENVPFNVGMVRVDGRTSSQWRQISVNKLTIDPNQLGYIDPVGDLTLRQEIAKYLNAARGVRCSPSQVMLVAGTQQATDLAIKVLLNPGDQVWIEDPAYPLTSIALEAAGMTLVPVPVDNEGLDVTKGIQAAPRARAAFVTPSHQYPLGVALSLQRRADLLAWASKSDSWIIEDDYDSEFRYDGAALPALRALDTGNRVIYTGSFSKVMFPGLRYGYMIIPPQLVNAFTAARIVSDRHQPIFFGAVLADFMQRGYFVSHIRRMRNEYLAARAVLVSQLQKQIGHIVDVSAPSQGMHLIVYLPEEWSDEQVSAAARQRGVVVRPISRLYRSSRPRPGLMLGFAGFDQHKLRTAATNLSRVIERFHQSASLSHANQPEG